MVMTPLSTARASYHSSLAMSIFNSDPVLLRSTRLLASQWWENSPGYNVLFPLLSITGGMNDITVCLLVRACEVPVLAIVIWIHIPRFHGGNNMATWDLNYVSFAARA
ncbi:hypothetical protein AAC387_Pa09g1210 [Persea americana]